MFVDQSFAIARLLEGEGFDAIFVLFRFSTEDITFLDSPSQLRLSCEPSLASLSGFAWLSECKLYSGPRNNDPSAFAFEPGVLNVTGALKTLPLSW